MPKPTPTRLPELTVRPARQRSKRSVSASGVRLVVVHEPVGSYEGTLAYILSGRPDVSYHVLTNEACDQATQLVPWNEKAWSCVQFNSVSDNISIAGEPKRWSFAALNRLARVVAFRLHKRGLPARFWSSPLRPPPKGTAHGFTYHRELGAAGGGHSDPRFSTAQHLFFVAAVKFHRQLGGFRKTWGKGDA